ncbi:type VI secretion system baseplate subunit TssE [Jannaschia sp. Os4]|uniref:type VI secretion system baseplate subunit TssE n=1 Tax=Jannaschia sp. Os4 TaxID=2807617 RepID=UPI00193AAFFD|nr:type VI secretion system baseplate subunit TssE [Jannaschia sp. Os4]MBM2578058.1 type VI secretion system baseplate subunit TssE [Jannaschia sp. Os4]
MARSTDVTRPDLRGGQRGKPPRQMSMMHVFRASAEAGDAREDPFDRGHDAPEGERARRTFRDTIDEGELRRHLALDLESLISTVRLDSAIRLDPETRVAHSVVNYGFADLSRASGTDTSRRTIASTIRASLEAFEPRLVPGSVVVEPLGEDEKGTNRLSFRVAADIAADPADLPLDFVAEVDLGAGKLRTKRLRQQRR